MKTKPTKKAASSAKSAKRTAAAKENKSVDVMTALVGTLFEMARAIDAINARVQLLQDRIDESGKCACACQKKQGARELTDKELDAIMDRLVKGSRYDITSQCDYMATSRRIGEAEVQVRFVKQVMIDKADVVSAVETFGLKITDPADTQSRFDKAISDLKLFSFKEKAVKKVPESSSPPRNDAPAAETIRFGKGKAPRAWEIRRMLLASSAYAVPPSRLKVDYDGEDHGVHKYRFSVYSKTRSSYRKGQKKDFDEFSLGFKRGEYPKAKAVGRFDLAMSRCRFGFPRK